MDASTASSATPPADVDERTVVFLDCGNIDRMPVDFLQARRRCTSSTSTTTTTTRASARSTSWCPRRRARPRSSATWRKELGVEITPRDRRGALHRPRHRHRQVHVREHDAGGARDGGRADRGRASSRTRSTGGSTRSCPSAGSSCSRARWHSVERYDDGAITIAHLDREDFEETGAAETDSEGIVDHMRPVEGTAVAVLVRELLADDRDGHAQGQPARRPTAASTCRSSRAASAAAGTAQAAGFTTDAAVSTSWSSSSREHVRDAARASADPGVLLVAKPAG